MKVTCYLDVFAWSTPDALYPVLKPMGATPEGGTRYRIEFEIPDPAAPDRVLAGDDVKVSKV